MEFDVQATVAQASGRDNAAARMRSCKGVETEEDENALRECFEDFLPSNRLDLGLQRLADVRDLAAADDTESFVLAYGLVVQSMPELGIEPAERLLAAREDIPRATQREVLEECRELLSNQMALTK